MTATRGPLSLAESCAVGLASGNAIEPHPEAVVLLERRNAARGAVTGEEGELCRRG